MFSTTWNLMAPWEPIQPLSEGCAGGGIFEGTHLFGGCFEELPHGPAVPGHCPRAALSPQEIQGGQISTYMEEILLCEGRQALAQVAQRSPIPAASEARLDGVWRLTQSQRQHSHGLASGLPVWRYVAVGGGSLSPVRWHGHWMCSDGSVLGGGQQGSCKDTEKHSSRSRGGGTRGYSGAGTAPVPPFSFSQILFCLSGLNRRCWTHVIGISQHHE